MSIEKVHQMVIEFVKTDGEVVPTYDTLLVTLLDNPDYRETAEEFFMEELSQTYFGWTPSDDVSLYQKIISGMINIHPEIMEDIEKFIGELMFFDDPEMEEVD